MEVLIVQAAQGAKGCKAFDMATARAVELPANLAVPAAISWPVVFAYIRREETLEATFFTPRKPLNTEEENKRTKKRINLTLAISRNCLNKTEGRTPKKSLLRVWEILPELLRE
jgi:hypothetical protein